MVLNPIKVIVILGFSKDPFWVPFYFYYTLTMYPIHQANYHLCNLQMIQVFFISGTSLSAISKILKDEMMNVCGWLKSNMLTLNETKTNYTIMTNQGR